MTTTTTTTTTYKLATPLRSFIAVHGKTTKVIREPKQMDTENKLGLPSKIENDHHKVNQLILKNRKRLVHEHQGIHGRAAMSALKETPTNVMGHSSSSHGTGAIDTFDPILNSMMRRRRRKSKQ